MFRTQLLFHLHYSPQEYSDFAAANGIADEDEDTVSETDYLREHPDALERALKSHANPNKWGKDRFRDQRWGS